MPPLLLSFMAIVAGITGLVWSADRFVAGSAAIANNMGVSKLVIGLTIVSLGTSAPEILVSLNAALEGAADLAVGNALGSNIANIGLVLAVTALISVIPIQQHLLQREIPMLIFVTLIAGVFLYDGDLLLWESVVLLLLLIPLLYLMFNAQKTHPEEVEEGEIPEMNNGIAVLWFLVGLVLLVISARVLVWGATETALVFGVSPLIIGLTIVALGTSLPELAASVMSAIKGHHDIAIGNIVGSNLFNILAVMSLPGIVGMEPLEEKVFYRDYGSMLAITVLLAAAIYVDYANKGHRRHGHLGKLIGATLLAAYLAYYVVLFITR